MAFLNIQDLRKSFGELEVLKGIDFSVEKGEVVAIIGSSGSGKTTLLRCITFLEMPNAGQIYLQDELLFDAKTMCNMKEKQLRDKRLHFGLVFQSFNLFPQYTVRRNIELALFMQLKEAKQQRKCMLKYVSRKSIAEYKARLNGKESGYSRMGLTAMIKNNKADYHMQLRQFIEGQESVIENRAADLLKQIGLTDKAANYPCQLSGGQQQRVAIARALALSPDILCFDEPTSALDPELTGEVLRVIKGLKTGNSTMIVVTHEMEFARNVADKIIFMADGVIEEMGTPNELFGNPQSDKLKNFISKDNFD